MAKHGIEWRDEQDCWAMTDAATGVTVYGETWVDVKARMVKALTMLLDRWQLKWPDG